MADDDTCNGVSGPRRPYLLLFMGAIGVFVPAGAIIHSIYIFSVYGTKSMPVGGAYNFPPLCCAFFIWPILLGVSVLFYFAVVRFSAYAAHCLIPIMILGATFAGLFVLIILWEVVYGPPARIDALLRPLFVSALFFGYFTLSAVLVNRWHRTLIRGNAEPGAGS